MLPRGVDLAISWQISTAFYPLCQRLGGALTGARLPGYDRSAMEHGTKVSPKVPPLSQISSRHITLILTTQLMNKLPREKIIADTDFYGLTIRNSSTTPFLLGV